MKSATKMSDVKSGSASSGDRYVGLLDGAGERVYKFSVPSAKIVKPDFGNEHAIEYKDLLWLVEKCDYFVAKFGNRLDFEIFLGYVDDVDESGNELNTSPMGGIPDD